MDLLKSENDENVTMEFHEACKKGDLDEITNILQRKEDIDVMLLDNQFTLKKAVQNGDSGIVQLLLRIGVNVNQKDRFYGIRPLHCACAAWGNLAIAKILLDNGADINATDEYFNRTALHFAVSNKKTSITKLLLKNGCNTKVRAKLTNDNDDLLGYTPFEVALDMKSIKVFKIIAFHET